MPRTPRAPRYPYRTNPPLPHHRKYGRGRLVQDAISGAVFGEQFAVQGPFGIVDGRDGGTLDLDVEDHEATPNNIPRPPL